MNAQRGSRGLAVLFLYPQGEMGVGGHCDVWATVPLRKTLNSYCTESWVGPGAGVDGCGKSCHHKVAVSGSSSP